MRRESLPFLSLGGSGASSSRRAASGTALVIGVLLVFMCVSVVARRREREQFAAGGPNSLFAGASTGQNSESAGVEGVMYWSAKELEAAGLTRESGRDRRLRAKLERTTGSHLPPSARLSVLHELTAEELLKQPFTSRLIVSERLRAVFCPMPKAANSNWKYVLRKLEGLGDYDDLTRSHNPMTSGLRYLSDYSARDIDAIVKGDVSRGVQPFFKFVFVRDPYTRLLSGYLDKFVLKNTSSSEYRLFLSQVTSLRKFQTRDLTNEPRLSFRSFVDELMKQDVVRMNTHWMPQTLVCGLGYFPYDFVGSFEHLSIDASAVLAHLGHADEPFPTQRDIGFPPSGTSAMVNELYTRELMLKARLLYDQDFLLLGY